ncbi:alanine racemase [Paenarthrobacter nitroguajacolicus]|uniref:alanine racemase n=1 Tax=Paenarthrobacter nitroguajacolicus TaxID=211146 RepID=UPI0040549232
MNTSEAISSAAVSGLAERRLDWRHKAVPATDNGTTHADFLAAKHTLAELQTPLLTLDANALAANADRLAKWCAEHGVLLAPHGKTTMSPQLWTEQLNRGAWGITLANFAQLRVAREFGVRNLQLANSLTDPHAIQWVARVATPDAPILSWIDSLGTVDVINRTLDGSDAVLDVLVELGSHGGRTGARGVDAAMEIARAISASPNLRLVGVSGYEGSLAHTADDAGLAAVRGYLAQMRLLHEELLAEGLYGSASVIITAGGSAYFDDVVTVLSPCINRGTGPRVDLMIRSGAYIIHDDGFYRGISPFSREGDAPFKAGMHGWARVVSQTEPGLAILDAGKRDLPFDEGLPEPQLIGSTLGGPMEPLVGAEITSVNDQHSFMTFDAKTATVNPGDVIRLGLSHPCTAFDKWTVIPVLNSSQDTTSSGDQTVVDLIHTFF